MQDFAKYQTFPDSFYEQPTVQVAQALLGQFLVMSNDNGEPVKVGLITETEAYPGITDRGSHSSRGLTPRTKTLFGPSGRFYVYLIYGMYHCLNVVTDTPESGGAVLFRAVKPILGIDGKTSGPGLLCKAYGIDKTYNELPVNQGSLTIRDSGFKIGEELIAASPRVGIDYAGDDKHQPWRFRIANPNNLVYD